LKAITVPLAVKPNSVPSESKGPGSELQKVVLEGSEALNASGRLLATGSASARGWCDMAGTGNFKLKFRVNHASGNFKLSLPLPAPA
jgi:hypothetical protein